MIFDKDDIEIKSVQIIKKDKHDNIIKEELDD